MEAAGLGPALPNLKAGVLPITPRPHKYPHQNKHGPDRSHYLRSGPLCFMSNSSVLFALYFSVFCNSSRAEFEIQYTLLGLPPTKLRLLFTIVPTILFLSAAV